MNALLKKLQFKDNPFILILDAPEEFAAQQAEMEPFTKVVTEPAQVASVDFILVFSRSTAELARQVDIVLENYQGGSQTLLWWAYPKKSSRKYTSDISRDNGWEPLGRAGFEAVRQVAIDDDWSALRFRQADHIKAMTRDKSRAMSREGKRKLRDS